MEFNNTFIQSANNVFLSYDRDSSAERLIRDLSLENNNTFNRFLITKVNGDEIDIPMIARGHIEQIINNSVFPSSGTMGFQTIILPLYENSIPQERRTFDSFIKQFFTVVDYNSRLQKITSNKGEVYYGGKGLIFDNRYNPLMLCTVKAKKVYTVEGAFKLAYFRPIIYINPIVFIESNKLINKGIIKKIIPYYTSREIIFSVPRYDTFYNDLTNEENGKAVVIIDNLDRFFVKPTVPKPQSCTTESLNECLVNNIDDILAML